MGTGTTRRGGRRSPETGCHRGDTRRSSEPSRSLRSIMAHDDVRPVRQSLRLPGFDYARHGGYFVTLCAHRRECLFGRIDAGPMILCPFGQIIAEEWRRTPEVRKEIRLGSYQIMPNHLHAVVFIEGGDGTRATGRSPLPAPKESMVATKRPHGPGRRTLGALVGGFKASTTKRINAARGLSNPPTWQRNYPEHVIRNESKLERIAQYIRENPLR